VNAQEILKLFEENGVITRKSHLVYASGLHGDTYIDKDMIYPNVELTSYLCNNIASYWHYGQEPMIEAVVAPEKGGIILSQWVELFAEWALKIRVF
jgi:orotate phosphoribosyltransferase